jgi:hypothetical protein
MEAEIESKTKREAKDSCIVHPSFSPAGATKRPLREDLSENGIVFIFVDVMYTDMSLKIVRSRVFVLLVWTEGTDVAWGVVHEAMAHHFILALETFPA